MINQLDKSLIDTADCAIIITGVDKPAEQLTESYAQIQGSVDQICSMICTILIQMKKLGLEDMVHAMMMRQELFKIRDEETRMPLSSDKIH